MMLHAAQAGLTVPAVAGPVERGVMPQPERRHGGNEQQWGAKA